MNATLPPPIRFKPRVITGFPSAKPGHPRKGHRPATPIANHDFLVFNARPDLSTDPVTLAMLERP
jgi:hypothetical protein